MEKFENEMKRKLEQRRLEPSGNAWERVSLQRNNKKRSPIYIMYWIAAAVVVGIGILAVWPTNDLNDVNAPSIEVTEVSQKDKVVPTPKTVEIETPNPIHPKVEIKSQAKLAQTPKPETTETPIVQPTSVERQALEEQKTQEILVAVEGMIKSGKQPNEDDIDQLIENARRDIAAGNGLSKKTDANALLKDSESEIDESFRSGIFENLFKQKRIKIAFSNK